MRREKRPAILNNIQNMNTQKTQDGAALAPVGGSAPSVREYEDAASDMREVIDNLALLLRRTSRKLLPTDPLRTQCVEYLKRIGQTGQPLRGYMGDTGNTPLGPHD